MSNGNKKKKTVWVQGEARIGHADTGHRRAQRKARKRLSQQAKAASLRATYGPARKPAPVIVRKLDD